MRLTKMININYLCGCKLGERGIEICTLHLVIFEDLLKEVDYGRFGWDVNQEIYNKITHCLNVDEQERRILMG